MEIVWGFHEESIVNLITRMVSVETVFTLHTYQLFQKYRRDISVHDDKNFFKPCSGKDIFCPF